MISKQFFTFVVLAACLAAANGERALKAEGPGTWFQCSSLSVLRIRVFAGKCTGFAQANCAATAQSISRVDKDFQIFSSIDTLCDSGKVKAFARAVAQAIAKVWASAAVKVRCDGVGWGCGWSFANGEAWAAAFAKALATAIAEVWTPKADAFCLADVEAIAVGFARAAAAAKADACAKGGQGTVSDFESAFASSATTIIAEAVAVASASACTKAGKDSGAAASESICFGQGSSTTDEDTDEGSTGGGSSSTGGGQIIPCGARSGPCCAPGYVRNVCLACTGCGGGAFWTKQREVGPDGTRIWNQRNGKMCNCGGEKQG